MGCIIEGKRGGGKPPPYGVQPISFIHMAWCIPAAGHIGPALREHTEPGSGGAEGPLALSPQQCEAWIESPTALLENHRTKSLKQLKIPILKVLLDFFQKIAGVQGAAPPVARRSGRNTRAAHGAKHPLAAASETPAPRTARNTRQPQRANSPIVHSAIRRWRNPRGVCRKAAVPTPSAGGGRRPYVLVKSEK